METGRRFTRKNRAAAGHFAFHRSRTVQTDPFFCHQCIRVWNSYRLPDLGGNLRCQYGLGGLKLGKSCNRTGVIAVLRRGNVPEMGEM